MHVHLLLLGSRDESREKGYSESFFFLDRVEGYTFTMSKLVQESLFMNQEWKKVKAFFRKAKNSRRSCLFLYHQTSIYCQLIDR